MFSTHRPPYLVISECLKTCIIENICFFKTHHCCYGYSWIPSYSWVFQPLETKRCWSRFRVKTPGFSLNQPPSSWLVLISHVTRLPAVFTHEFWEMFCGFWTETAEVTQCQPSCDILICLDFIMKMYEYGWNLVFLVMTNMLQQPQPIYLY